MTLINQLDFVFSLHPITSNATYTFDDPDHDRAAMDEMRMGNVLLHGRIVWIAIAFALLPGLLALQLPPSSSITTAEPLAASAPTQLDHILRSADISLPSLSSILGPDEATIQSQARNLVTETQRARVAIASHIVDNRSAFTRAKHHPLSAPSRSRDSALTEAEKLQDELMARIRSRFTTLLNDNLGRVGAVEWQLHRGLRQGVADTSNQLGIKFDDKILNPDKFHPLATFDGERLDNRERLSLLFRRLKRFLKQIDPFAAIRRYRIRRLLSRLSDHHNASSASPSTAAFPSLQNSSPKNVDQLRAQLSAITALKAVQSHTAAADAKDAHAAQKLENAPILQSDLVLDKVELPPKKMMEVKKTSKGLPGGDGTRAPRRWVYAFNQQGPPLMDWSNVPIPGMAR